MWDYALAIKSPTSLPRGRTATELVNAIRTINPLGQFDVGFFLPRSAIQSGVTDEGAVLLACLLEVHARGID